MLLKCFPVIFDSNIHSICERSPTPSFQTSVWYNIIHWMLLFGKEIEMYLVESNADGLV